MTPDPLTALETALQQLREGGLDGQNFSNHARELASALSHLPRRYGEVLHDLLNRIESSAAFTEESCSFSQRDLIESVQMWLDRARRQAQASMAAPTA